MGLSRAEQARILRDDAKRRNARIAAEDALLNKAVTTTPSGIDPYHFSRSITGQPKDRHRIVKASDNCWNRGLRRTRTIGVADSNNPTPFASVKVTQNGTTDIVPASRFRATRTTVKRNRTIEVSPHIPDCVAMASTIGYIGDVE